MAAERALEAFGRYAEHLECLIVRGSHERPAVGREVHAAHRAAVGLDHARLALDGRAPQAHRAVRRARGDEVAIRREADAVHWLAMALSRSTHSHRIGPRTTIYNRDPRF